jgi:hypothetical protein
MTSGKYLREAHCSPILVEYQILSVFHTHRGALKSHGTTGGRACTHIETLKKLIVGRRIGEGQSKGLLIVDASRIVQIFDG